MLTCVTDLSGEHVRGKASLRNASDPAIVEGDPAAFLGAALGPHDELIR